MTHHAKSVAECWRIARDEANAYQRRLNTTTDPASRMKCQAARDAASRIALAIRYGRGRHTKPKR